MKELIEWLRDDLDLRQSKTASQAATALEQQQARIEELESLAKEMAGTLKTIYEDFDCDRNAHDYGTDCRCCIANKSLERYQEVMK